MKRKKITWHNVAVVLGLLVPEAIFFWAAHNNVGSVFLFAALVFLYNAGFLVIRFFLVRFIFEKKDSFAEHILVMFLTSNFLFFGFASWVFMESGDLPYLILPYALFAVYVFVWLSQKHLYWEIFTFLSLALSIFFAWQLVVSLGFAGWTLAALTLYSVFICAYNWAKTHKLEIKNALFFALMMSLVLSEVAWVLLLWPIDLLTLSLIMLGIFYIFGILSLRSHKNTLRKKHVVRYVSVGLVYFVALCLTTTWKFPFS